MTEDIKKILSLPLSLWATVIQRRRSHHPFTLCDHQHATAAGLGLDEYDSSSLPSGQCSRRRIVSSMDVHDPAEGSQKRSRALSSEQQRKFQELRERRLQLKNAQDKKKKRKRGKKGKHLTSTAEVAIEKEPPPDDKATDTASSGNGQRHVFSIDSRKCTDGSGEISGPLSSTSQSSQAGGDRNLEIVASTTSTGPSGIIPAKTPEVPVTEVAPSAKQKRKKLHWGMEIKERWERKGNM